MRKVDYNLEAIDQIRLSMVRVYNIPLLSAELNSINDAFKKFIDVFKETKSLQDVSNDNTKILVYSKRREADGRYCNIKVTYTDSKNHIIYEASFHRVKYQNIINTTYKIVTDYDNKIPYEEDTFCQNNPILMDYVNLLDKYINMYGLSSTETDQLPILKVPEFGKLEAVYKPNFNNLSIYKNDSFWYGMVVEIAEEV